MLASLAATDPDPLRRLLGIDDEISVRREVAVAGSERRSDRVDILLTRHADGSIAAVIEAKVLSDLSLGQLMRYESAFSEAASYWLLHLRGFPLDLQDHANWQSLTWESVLDAHVESESPWVSQTARAWREQIRTLVPHVDAATVWNDVPDEPRDFELALRARMVWLAGRMTEWCEIGHDLVQSTAGGSWVARMWTPSSAPGHMVSCEIEEGMTAQAWKPDPHAPYCTRMAGPSIWVGLRQEDVETSADFDWGHLHRIFVETVLDGDGQPRDLSRAWQPRPPNFRDAGDKERWRVIVTAGAPAWLGKGFGMAQARKYGDCLFGARYRVDADCTLGQVDDELRRLQSLIEQMGAVLHD